LASLKSNIIVKRVSWFFGEICQKFGAKNLSEKVFGRNGDSLDRFLSADSDAARVSDDLADHVLGRLALDALHVGLAPADRPLGDVVGPDVGRHRRRGLAVPANGSEFQCQVLLHYFDGVEYYKISRGRFLKQKPCSATGKAWHKPGRLVTEIFFHIKTETR
jgi:hypothetical protein